MGYPVVIGYMNEYVGPAGMTLGLADASEALFIRRRPIYRSREFRAVRKGDVHWKVTHERCEYHWLTTCGPHDSAEKHLQEECPARHLLNN